MKRIALVAILVMALVSSAFAFQNEPKGFRKLYWGNSPTSTMEFWDDMDEFMKIYHDPTEKKAIGSVGFSRMFFAFYVDVDESLKFAGVTLFYRTKGNFDTLEILCNRRFGPATDKEYQDFSWEGAISTVHLKHNSIEDEGFLSIDSSGLWDRYLKRKEDREVEAAKDDW